jgi:hypothetical protein
MQRQELIREGLELREGFRGERQEKKIMQRIGGSSSRDRDELIPGKREEMGASMSLVLSIPGVMPEKTGVTIIQDWLR